VLKPLSNIKQPRDTKGKTTFLTYAQLLDTTQNLVGLSADKLRQVVDTRLATASGSDRLTMLLNEVRDVQMALKEDLEKHLQRSNPLYFETYTQFTSAELVNELNKPCPGFYESDADVNAADENLKIVLDAAVNLNGALAELFKDLADRADVADIQSQLKALHDLVAGYNKRISGSMATIGKI